MRKNLIIFLTVVITAIIFSLAELGVFYYIYHKNKKNISALRNAVYNDRVCPVEADKGIYYCPYKNVELTPPGPRPEFNALSFYLANLVGKLENKHPLPGFVLMEIYIAGDEDLFGVVLGGKEKAYIIFRGTRTPDEWKKDFAYYQRPEPGGNAFSYKQNKIILEKTGGLRAAPLRGVERGGDPVMIHGGFLDIYAGFKDRLLEKINSLGDIPIVVSGHSLGAGVATVAAFDLKSMGKKVVSIVFASPRVGNQAFADILDKGDFHFQWANTADAIFSLPYSVSPNFSDPGDPYIYTHGGKINYFTLNKESLINNHTISTYIQHITALARN